MTRNPHTVLRIEIASAVGCAILGTLCRLGGHTLKEISLVFFGWSIGCVFHIAVMYLTRQMPNHKNSD